MKIYPRLLGWSMASVFSLFVKADPALPAPDSGINRGDAVTAELSYHESTPTNEQAGPVAPTPTLPAGGDFTSEIIRITVQISSPSGASTEGTQEKKSAGSASLTINLRPVLDHQNGSWKVTVELSGNPQWTIDPNLSPESLLGCTADHDKVLAGLASWSTNLDLGQQAQLGSQGFVTLPLKEPFADLQCLSQPNVTLKVTAPLVQINPLTIYDRAWRLPQIAINGPLDRVTRDLDLLRIRNERDTERFNTLTKECGDRRKQMSDLVPQLQPIYDQIQALYDEAAENAPLDSDGKRKIKFDAYQNGKLLGLLGQMAPFQLQYDRLKKADDPAEQQLEDVTSDLEAEEKSRAALVKEQASLQEQMLAALQNPYIEQVDIKADGAPVAQRVFERANADAARQLDALLRNLQDAENAFAAAQKVHDAARDAFVGHEKQAQKLLAIVADLIVPTADAQRKVDWVFNAGDMLEAFFTKGGFKGVAVEFVGKYSELAVKNQTDANGPDLFSTADANSSVAQMNGLIHADLTDPTAWQQLAKTALTDGAQDLTSGRLKDYANTLLNVDPKNIQVFRQNAGITTSIERAGNKLSSLERARGYGAKDMVETALKETLKTGFQNHFAQQEIDAWKNYFAEELQARMVYPIYQVSNRNYQDALDWLNHATAALEAFKANSPEIKREDLWKNTLDRSFSEKAILLVTLRARKLPEGQKYEVKIGPDLASPTGDMTFSYQLPAQVTRSVAVTVSETLN